MPEGMLNILLAEDDPHLGILLVDYLRMEGFATYLCKDGARALQAFGANTYDLCLLDVMLPKMDGFSLARQIRKVDEGIPIIFITAKDLREDKLRGYGLGADDYITKPFDEEELLWKIKAVIRRVPGSKAGKRDGEMAMGKYLFNANQQSLTIGGRTRRITERESDVLYYLWQHRNTVIKREVVLQALWGENDYFLGRSLDVFITRIRKYLKEDAALSIENVFGVGFIFNVPDQQG